MMEADQIDAGGEGPRELDKPNRHKHKLQRFDGRGLYKCTGCKEMGMDLGYECSTPSRRCGGGSIFHVQCAILEDEEQHRVRTDLTFRFRPKTKRYRRRCTACDHELNGFLYKTEQPKMRLHPLCLILPSEFKYEKQSFKLITREGDPYECCYCNNTIKHGWKYKSGNVCMDVGCAKYYLQGLSAQGIQSSPVRRRRDQIGDVGRYVMATVGLAAGLAGVANFFQGYFG